MTALIKQSKRYKFLRLVDNKIQSELGSAVWKIGEWKMAEGELELCKTGFHCSLRPYDAFCYRQGEIFAEVDIRGEYISACNKEYWREMRIVNAEDKRQYVICAFRSMVYDVILNPLPPGVTSGTCATVGCTANMRFVQYGRPPPPPIH